MPQFLQNSNENDKFWIFVLEEISYPSIDTSSTGDIGKKAGYTPKKLKFNYVIKSRLSNRRMGCILKPL